MVETTFIFCPSVYDESDRENVRHWCGMLFIFLVSIFIHFTSVDVNGSGPECHLTAHADVEKSLTEH